LARQPTQADKNKSRTGFAVFMDLRDSTYFWNQNADLAEEILKALAATVRAKIPDWGAEIGNFTGDGFLLLFPQAEYAIQCLAEIINAWEPQRRDFLDKFSKLAPLPDNQHSLMLRTGVSYGFYRQFDWDGKTDFAGEALNRASRCEAASKEYFARAEIGDNLPLGSRIFITPNVLDLIQSKTDYWYSAKLSVSSKGYERPTPDGLADSSEHIVAIWPREPLAMAEIKPVAKKTLEAAAKVASGDDIIERLQETRQKEKVADELSDAAEGVYGKAAREILARAIQKYRDALQSLPTDAPEELKAGILVKVGSALGDRAKFLAGKECAEHLSEAVAAYREALKVYTLESSPTDYATTQNNLGNALCKQAGLLSGEACAKRLGEAVAAFQAALKVYTLKSLPADYAMTQNNLGNALGGQAALLSGKARAERLGEAVAAYHEALKVYTLESSPSYHAATQNNLGNALLKQVALLSGNARAELLGKAVAAYHEALKVYTLESSPADYAMTQNNLGTALREQATLLSGKARAERLGEAVAAFQAALKVHTFDAMPAQYAATQYNLGNLLGYQASILTGRARAAAIKAARTAYSEAGRVVTPDHFPREYEWLKKGLEALDKL
jgi:class 3 adenylate cyclase/DNA-binding ferritin-like protein (Dps family)